MLCDGLILSSIVGGIALFIGSKGREMIFSTALPFLPRRRLKANPARS